MDKSSLLLVRVKGGPAIGMGHLSRAMAVAEAARRQFGMRVLFLRNADQAVAEVLSRNAFDSVVIESGASPGSLGALLHERAAHKESVCIIDSKEDLSGEILVMREQGISVLLLDNFTPARFRVSTNIYPVVHFDFRSLDWQGYAGEVLGGAAWVPLAERFAGARSSVRPLRERKALLVTMGGADPNRLTLKVMDALAGFRSDVAIRVVLGFSCTFVEEVRTRNRETGNRFTIVERADHMDELMRDAGLAVTALGTTIYELAYLGVPTMVISNYREDERDERELEKFGCVMPLGFHANLSVEHIRGTAQALWADTHKRNSMSELGLLLIDGLGAERVARKVQGLMTHATNRQREFAL
jgi:spore coat polysaccharide biosynthesis predicted glycosyltransferase SpsG